MSFSTPWYTPHQHVNMSPFLQVQHSILQLPTEIICKIFQSSLSDSPFDDNKPQEDGEDGDIEMSPPVSKMTTPFTLSAVCHFWREIAFKDPSLWSSVYLVTVPNRAVQQTDLLRGWLSRTGSLPLTIEIDCFYDGDEAWFPDDSEKAQNLLRAIFLHSTRITTFRTRLPPSCLWLPDPENNINFEKLTTLSIVPLDAENEEDGETDVINLFWGARELRQVHIREIGFTQLVIPWENITKVTTLNVYLEDCVKILRETSSSLEECDFLGILYPMQVPEPGPIFLPRLNRLLLDFREMDVSGDLITRIITAPELKALVYITQHNDPFPVQDFVSCTQRSGCTLTDLSILQPSMTDTDLQECLAQVALSLEHLRVELTSDQEDFITATTLSKQVLVGYFPRLRGSILKGPLTTFQSFVDTVQHLSHPLQ